MHTIYRHPDLHETNYSLRPLWHELREGLRPRRKEATESEVRRRPVTARAGRSSDRVKTGADRD